MICDIVRNFKFLQKLIEIEFSHLGFHKLGRFSDLKYRETTYSQLNFHEW